MSSKRPEDTKDCTIKQEYGEVNPLLLSINKIKVESGTMVESKSHDLEHTKMPSSHNDNYNNYENFAYTERVVENEKKIDLFSLENIDNFSCSRCKGLVKKNDTIRLPQYDSENPLKLVCGDCFHNSYQKREDKRFEFMIISRDGKCVCKNRVCERALEAYKKVNTDISESFKCYECHQRFLLKQALEIHIDIVHRKKSIFQCNECSRVFLTKQKLICHMRIHHLKTKKHSCSECSNLPKKKKMLLSTKPKHADIVNGLQIISDNQINNGEKVDSIVQNSDGNIYFEVPLENIVIYKCTLCNRLMDKNDAFRFLKYNNDPVKLVCSDCYQCDYNSENINNFLCCECGKAFQHKHQLKCHIAAVHNKLFKCKECFKVLSSKHNLDSHIDRIHWKK